MLWLYLWKACKPNTSQTCMARGGCFFLISLWYWGWRRRTSEAMQVSWRTNKSESEGGGISKPRRWSLWWAEWGGSRNKRQRENPLMQNQKSQLTPLLALILTSREATCSPEFQSHNSCSLTRSGTCTLESRLEGWVGYKRTKLLPPVPCSPLQHTQTDCLPGDWGLLSY